MIPKIINQPYAYKPTAILKYELQKYVFFHNKKNFRAQHPDIYIYILI